MKMHLMIAVIAATGIFLSCNQAHKEQTNANDVVMKDAKQKTPGSLSITGDGSEGILQEEKPEELQQQTPSIPIKKIPPAVPADWDKQIIKNAELQMRVKELKPASAAILEAIRSSGGYIASASEVQLSSQLRSEMLIRVPREKFEELLSRLSGYADSIADKRITSEDVTGEYIDTKARIQVKEKTRDQYYEFLKRAKNIEEVLKVQSEITGLQEDIEAAKGRINYIQHQSALSNIRLVFYQDIPYVNIPDTTPGFGLELISSIKTGWTIIQSLIIMMVSIWPFLILGLSVWFMFRRKKLKLVSQTK